MSRRCDPWHTPTETADLHSVITGTALAALDSLRELLHVVRAFHASTLLAACLDGVDQRRPRKKADREPRPWHGRSTTLQVVPVVASLNWNSTRSASLPQPCRRARSPPGARSCSWHDHWPPLIHGARPSRPSLRPRTKSLRPSIQRKRRSRPRVGTTAHAPRGSAPHRRTAAGPRGQSPTGILATPSGIGPRRH